ncbi:hypothetical protein [Pajaroellobacter abortibovis]|uniref:Uncharacterized protein n=1 Tax=Pajaroellobacter abortibovis TaxID=1882918 RepID=A0A1L6MXI6_9BACT|nr:hypothetical protein [Pajaroellobacter abortibovis]APS00301.1 hypothetical protein BCY86_06105 [Pajaroellobacter abortibovis]
MNKALGIAIAAMILWMIGEKKTFAAPAKGVITLREVTIVARVQKPVASLDVSKIQPKLTLTELKQPFLSQIEQAVSQEPF